MRFKKLFIIASMVLFAIHLKAEAATDAQAKIGMNIAGISDWNTELPLVDVFKMSRPWISHKKGAKWGKGPKLEYDKNGWVTKIEPDCWIEMPLCTISGGHYPSGEYTILYEGEGNVDAGGAAKVKSKKPGEIIIDVNSKKGPVWLSIRKMSANYIKNIKVIMPGFIDSYKENPWHPAFLKRWKGMKCLRFMDLMATNNSKIKSWDDRPKLTDASYARKGVPLELLIDLANRQKIAPWFCIPHLADDNYIRKTAEMVKDKLLPSLPIYIEYSNELWNGQFKQTKYVGKKGIELGLGAKEKPWEAGWHYNALRSVQIFKIWEDVFGGKKRLMRILASQSVNSYVSEQILKFKDAYKNADALAIAPYFSCNVSPKSTPDIETVEKWSLAQLFQYLKEKSLPDAILSMQKSKAMADKYGLKLVAYEGGQHMVGVRGGENSKKIEKLFQQANQDPRMGKLYMTYYNGWKDAGGDLFCVFSSVSKWSKWGSWGLMQYYDDSPLKSPKYKSTIEWAKAQGQKVNMLTNSDH